MINTSTLTGDTGGPHGSALHILVVEDEEDIAGLIKHTLERSGGAVVDVVSSGDAALASIRNHPPSFVILDVNLPVLNGFEVCRRMRASDGMRDIPVIMLTARTTELDRVTGLDLGADDYMTKPFSLRELAARVRAVLRRRGNALSHDSEAAVFRGKRLSMDFDAIAVAVEGVPVRLTRREFDLLRLLVENRNRVLSRDRLLERVWGYDASVETRSVDVHVGRLRAKLGPAAKQIETAVGFGYRFVE